MTAMAESQGVAELRGKYDDLVERIHGVDVRFRELGGDLKATMETIVSVRQFAANGLDQVRQSTERDLNRLETGQATMNESLQNLSSRVAVLENQVQQMQYSWHQFGVMVWAMVAPVFVSSSSTISIGR